MIPARIAGDVIGVAAAAFVILDPGMYRIARVLICAAAAVVAYNQNDHDATFWLFGGIAALFNPFLPVYLGSRNVWLVIDIAVALMFGFDMFRSFRRAKAQRAPSSTVDQVQGEV